MKKRIVTLAALLCICCGLITIIAWQRKTQRQTEQRFKDKSKENELLNMELNLLLDNSMLQYIYNGLSMANFSVYDEYDNLLKLSDLLDENYKVVLKFSQYHCTSCVDYMLKEVDYITEKSPKDRIIIIGAYENKRIFRTLKKKYDINIPFYFLKIENDSDIILADENVPYICMLNSQMVIKDLLIPIKELPSHIQKYYSIILQKYPIMIKK